MAKKKKKHPQRRRRMGATGMGGVMEGLKLVIGGALGIVGGRMINTAMGPTATTPVPAISPTLVGAAEFAGGVFMVSKVKNSLAKGIGIGLAGNGALYMAGAKGLNVLPASMGYPPPGPVPYRAVNGYYDVPKVGFPKPGAIGFPKPGAIGFNQQPADMEMARQARMYAGVYN